MSFFHEIRNNLNKLIIHTAHILRYKGMSSPQSLALPLFLPKCSFKHICSRVHYYFVRRVHAAPLGSFRLDHAGPDPVRPGGPGTALRRLLRGQQGRHAAQQGPVVPGAVEEATKPRGWQM